MVAVSGHFPEPLRTLRTWLASMVCVLLGMEGTCIDSRERIEAASIQMHPNFVFWRGNNMSLHSFSGKGKGHYNSIFLLLRRRLGWIYRAAWA